jgi:hypothetical protein
MHWISDKKTTFSERLVAFAAPTHNSPSSLTIASITIARISSPDFSPSKKVRLTS